MKLTRFESTKIFDCVKGRWGSYFIAEDTEIFFDGKAFLRSQRFLTASKGGGSYFIAEDTEIFFDGKAFLR